MGKSKPVDWEQNLKEEFLRWDHLSQYGGSDPFWSDGVNLNLVRNHIIYSKRELEKAIQSEEGLPEIYYRETPPEVDEDYYVDSGRIRDKAVLILDQYLNHEDFQFLITVLPTITKEENKITSIKNVVGYVTGLAISIKDGDLSVMRRHVLGYEGYMESFVTCAQKMKALRSSPLKDGGQISIFSMDRESGR